MRKMKDGKGIFILLDIIIAAVLLYILLPAPWIAEFFYERDRSYIWLLYAILLFLTGLIIKRFKNRILLLFSDFSWKQSIRNFIDTFHITKRDLFIVVVFLFIGGVLRLIGINWGITHIFQPDEKKLVKASIEMAADRSLYHYYFGYPNEFISKIVALVIIIWSKISGMEIESDAIGCYFIFRGCVAIISACLIVTSYLIGNYLHKNLGIIVCGLVAIFPPFINYAKQVTGDIPVAFFASLVMISSYYYLENKKNGSVIVMALFSALATLEKWHGGVLCIYMACIIAYGCFKERSVKKFIEQGLLAAASWVGWIFIIAPNVIWNIKDTVTEFLSIYISGDWYERPKDIWIFFFKCFFSHGGLIGTSLVLCGFVFLIKNKNEKYLVLVAGLLNWLIMSAIMNRIFERWGMECYLVLLLLQAMGILFLFSCKKRVVTIAAFLCLFITAGNYVIGCIRYDCLAAYSRQDTRLIGEAVFEELGITKDNSVYDYYSPFSPGGIRSFYGTEGQKSKSMNDYIIEVDGTVYITEPDKIFAVASEYRGALNHSGGYALLEQNAASLGDILSFHPDLFHADKGMGDWRTIEFANCYRSLQEIYGILRGEAMGPVLKLYDISKLEVKVEEG